MPPIIAYAVTGFIVIHVEKNRSPRNVSSGKIGNILVSFFLEKGLEHFPARRLTAPVFHGCCGFLRGMLVK